mgnify:CR=1 FL=1
MPEHLHKRKHLTSFQLIILGFAGVILIGALILTLPVSSASGVVTPFDQALFTSTSAVCVTGLVVQDTGSYWSIFGQAVILALIQIGGLGVVTVAVSVFMLSGRKISLMQRSTMQDAISAPKVGGIVRLTKFILRGTFLIEALGAVLLFPVFCRDFGIKGIWMSVFHSISAFCNAGFDLFDNSMANYANDPYMLCVLAVLIVAGSLGFLVWKDILNYPKYHRLSLHTQLALRTGAVLFVVSVVVYFITEKNLAQLSDKLSFSNRILNTIFMAITPRTAGLITFPYTDLSAAGLAFTVILMFIGGTPGSTAGGVKTTTIGLLTIQSFATLRGQRDTTFAHRRFTQENIYRALTLLFVALFILLVSILVLVETQDLPKHDSLAYVTFEAVAAFGTTGISLGITTHLNLLGQFIIMFLMFVGRVGIYTVMFSILNASTAAKNYRYPEESVLIG